MLDLPEDVSNKKYLNVDNVEVTTPADVVVTENNREPIKIPKKRIKFSLNLKQDVITKENLKKLRLRIKEKWNYFKTVQYPALYAKFYDLYYFELVPNKPLDLALKILILLTLLIVLFIVVMIFLEFIRLLFK